MIEDKNINEVLMSIWRIVAHFRPTGQMNEMQLQQTAVAFTFLRRIDCLIGLYSSECAAFYSKNAEALSNERLSKKLCEISGGYPFYNYSGYNFKEILQSNNSIEVVMNSYLQGFSKNVQDILSGMDFYNNLAVLMRQSRFLVDLLVCCLDLDFSSSNVDNEEFVQILTSMLGNTSSVNGSFFTGINLSRLICECLMTVDVRDKKDDYVTIYDPVCGTGGLLSLAGEEAKTFAVHQDNISLYGQEISVFPSAIAKALVMLCGNEYSSVYYGDTLTDDHFRDLYFKYIVADMPYGISWKTIQARIQMETYDATGRFSMGLPNVGDSQFLFIENIISKMDPMGSRAAFITSPAILWAGDARSGESRIRRWMFEHDLIETIIALPSSSHTRTSLPIYLWILSNKKSEEQKGKVRLIDIASMVGKTWRFGLRSELVVKIIDEYKSKNVSAFSQFFKNDQFGYFEVDLLENGKKREKVTISLDTDINDFVKKERQPYAKGEITIDYTSVEKGYSIQFEKFFAKEEVEVSSLPDATYDLLAAIDIVASLKNDITKIKTQTGKIKWEEYPLYLATDIILGGPKPTNNNSEGLPLLSVAYLRNPSSEDPHYEISPRTKCATKEDVIVIVRGENSGEVFRGVDGILSSSVAAIKCIDETAITPQYMYYLLKGHEKTLRSLAKGPAQKSLDLKSLQSLKCSIPPIEVQKKIVSNIDDIVSKIDKIIAYTGSTDNVFATYRQTLIENAVRGKLKIS